MPRDFDGAFEGSLEVDGTETRTWEPGALSARVGIVFQDPESQLVMERVEDDIAFGLENRGWLRGRMLARVPEALREVGLDGFERRRTSRLSGEQQRVALGGVLAALPGILVLDEPTANLDPGGTADFFARLAAIKSQGDDDRARRAQGRPGLADRGPRPGARRRGPADRPGASRRGPRALGVRMRREGIWLPERWWPVPVAGPANPTGPTLIEAHGLRFGYDRTDPILRDIDLSPGAPSGSRSSAPTAAASRRWAPARRPPAPDHGTLLLGADEPSRLPPAELARRAGYVFQDPETQFLANTVADEVMLGLRPDERARPAP